MDEGEFRRIRSRLSLEFFKWDSQVGDVSALFPQPLLLNLEVWNELSRMSETLAAELMLAEEQLFCRPDLHTFLGVPKPLRSALRKARKHGRTPAALRSLRFDFHYSMDGWRISEVNSDVPGGYAEASVFTELMATHTPGAKTAGNPAAAWVEAMMSQVDGGHVALLSAVGFLEDQQVTAFLASQLQQRGVETVLIHHPAQLFWESGHASTISRGNRVKLDAILRFYQGEWLAQSSNSHGWEWLFAGGRAAVTNPGIALLTESKRFPLTWNALSTSMAMWRNLLPECCDPREQSWQVEDDWLLKMAYSNTGDEVHVREHMDPRAWKNLCSLVRRRPEEWVAQRRFRPVSIMSDIGPVYPCIGVYVINGHAAGAYVRVATRDVVDYSAMDAVLLIRENIDVL